MSNGSRTDSRVGHTGRHFESTTNTVISGTNTTKSTGTGTCTGTGVGTYTTGSTERSTDFTTMNPDMETLTALDGGGTGGGAGGSRSGVGSYPAGSACTVDLSHRSTAVTPIVQAMGGQQRATSSVGAASFISGSDFGGEEGAPCSSSVYL